jgi:hypothetical protein
MHFFYSLIVILHIHNKFRDSSQNINDRMKPQTPFKRREEKVETVVSAIQRAKTRQEVYSLLEGKSSEQLNQIAHVLNIKCHSRKKDDIKVSILRGLTK